MSAPKHAVVVVGGGIAGMMTASKLIAAGISDVKVFEGRPSPGGRVKTTRDGDNKPLYNDFAWRVSEENTRMLALAKELQIELQEQTTPAAGAPSETDSLPPIEGKAPLSKYATVATRESASLADQRDRESGYAGRIGAISFPGESHGDRHWVVKNGMNEFVTKVKDLLPEGVLNTGHRVTDVALNSDGSYRVELFSGGQASAVEAATVVLAAPPVSLRQFSVAREGLNPALFAVHERRNGHIYVKCAPADNVPDTSDGPTRIYRAVPDSLLQQVISGDYGNSIFQAGYACDRFERVWRELQFQGPDALRNEVASQLDRLIETALPELRGVVVEEVYLRIGFVHRWQVEAHVLGKNKAQLSQQALYPNPAQLPNLHLVGEAFSAHHGWTEGALQTAEDAAKIIVAAAHSQSSGSDGDSDGGDALLSPFSRARELNADAHMQYRGLLLDVSQFAGSHPGGQGPIRGFRGKDASNFFDSMHPGWPNALATIFGLQDGSLKK
jgi:Flavin containing amine oxidoreductase/Cytochrome b5-like Heme/Steroid binding domain